MLQVLTYIRPKGISGLGVYAWRPIPAGTLVLAPGQGGIPVPGPRPGGLPAPGGESPSGCITLKSLLGLCTRNGRHLGHADAPNTAPVDGSPHLYAVRDIAAGEELTCDHNCVCMLTG